MAQITWPRNGREPLRRSGVAAGALLVGLVSSVVTGETLLKNRGSPLPTHPSHWLRRQGVEGLFQVAVHSRQVDRLTVKNDLAIMDEKDPVGHRLDLLENVGRNQN